MNTTTRPVAAAEVFGVPSAATKGPAPERLDTGYVLGGIGEMLDGCGSTDRNELLTLAITALIEAGFDTAPRIVGAAKSLGFSAGHAGAVLGKGRGWRRGEGGAYRLVAA